jgi:hypothetical protein
MTYQESSFHQAEDFARMAAQLLSERYEQPTLDRVVEMALQTVESCDYCSLSLHKRRGPLAVVAATDPIAEKVAAVEDELGEGPSLDPDPWVGTTSIDNVSGDSRWPRWGARAVELGVGSMLAIHLNTARQSEVATLNLLAREAHAFDAGDLAVAGIFARLAAAAVDAARHDEGLRSAARSRQIIGVAQGRLMQRFGMTLDQSFELLRRYSRDHNIKLRILAERLAETGIPDTGDAAGSLEHAFRLESESSIDLSQGPATDQSEPPELCHADE